MGRSIEAPVFRPTKADMATESSFERYIESIEKEVASVGICKIVAPKGWTARRQGYSTRLDAVIPRPIRQHASGKCGVYRTILVEEKQMSLRYDFMPAATAPENQPPVAELEDDRHPDLERRFWKNVCLQPPLYGADVEGTLFDKDLKGWNLQSLSSLLSRTLQENKLAIPGVSTSYLYFGMWRSLFAWHTEDMDLASVNYLHYGANKSWYCIPPAHRLRFEQLVKDLLPELFRQCPEFFRHKELLVSPYVLESYNIPVVRMVQRPGEFVINVPGSYHCGFNHGYNCAESTNFATRAWIGVGARAASCQCTDDSVTIDMSLFLKAAQPRIRKELRSILAARQAAAASSDDESEDSAPSCASAGDALSGPESAGSVSAAESAAHQSVGSRNSSDPESPANALHKGGRKRAALEKRRQQPPAKRQRSARTEKPSKAASRGTVTHVAVAASVSRRGRRSDVTRAPPKKQPAVISQKAVRAVVKKQPAVVRQKTNLPSAPARRRRAPLMRASLDAVRRRKPSSAGRAPATAAPSVVPARVSSRPLRLAAQGVNKLVQALVRGRS